MSRSEVNAESISALQALEIHLAAEDKKKNREGSDEPTNIAHRPFDLDSARSAGFGRRGIKPPPIPSKAQSLQSKAPDI